MQVTDSTDNGGGALLEGASTIWRRKSQWTERRKRNENRTANAPGKLRSHLIQCFWVARQNAKVRGIPFVLTRTEFDSIVEHAGGRCEVSGIPFDLRFFASARRRPFAPSLDRMDATLAYTQANCRLVAGIVNAALSDWGEEPLRILISAMHGRPLLDEKRGHNNYHRAYYHANKEKIKAQRLARKPA